MRSKSELRDDQNDAIDFIFGGDESFLIAPTGTGKTVMALTAAAELLRDEVLGRILIIAPLKVCETAWSDEAAKWEHLHDLDIGIATGSPLQRAGVIWSEAPIVAINEENVAWLTDLDNGEAIKQFDGIIIDETSHWTNVGSKKTGARFKALRGKMKGFSWRCGLTAQPVAEDWIGLYGQVLLLDLGKRLGKLKQTFMETYFYRSDFGGFNWEMFDGSAEAIADKIRDLVHVVPDTKAETLPPKNVSFHYIEMDEDTRKIYNTMRTKRVLRLPGNITIEAENAGVLSGKLEQIANGFSYIDHGEGIPRGVVVHHRYKSAWITERAREIVGYGDNLIVVYWFGEDLAWLRPAFPGALELAGGVNVSSVMERWNDGTSGQLLLLHPASAGHGVDGLQESCHRQLWVAPCWSRDKWMQTPDRLWRGGQTEPVEIEVCMMNNTVDQVKLDAAEGKGEYNELFLQHLE